MNSSDPLNPFDDYPGNLMIIKSPAYGFHVVERQDQRVLRLVYRCYQGRIVGQRNRCRCPPVKSFGKSNEFLPARHERGQLDGILIGFGTRIAQKQLVRRVPAHFPQLAGQLFLQGISYRIGVKTDLLQLVINPGHIMGV